MVEAADENADIATLPEARAEVQDCRRCQLYANATQAVFGEGAMPPTVMFVGEQPGDKEDLAGRPFVGPAGRVLDAALDKVGIDRSGVYVTNAVKHFKFAPRGKKRLHQRPNAGEVRACKFWLDLEIRLVGPRIIVALGATAAQSILGRSAGIGKLRGAPIPLEQGRVLFVTNHPSYLLRLTDSADRDREQARFEADLTLVREFARHLG
jgi:DNA polymerase